MSTQLSQQQINFCHDRQQQQDKVVQVTGFLLKDIGSKIVSMPFILFNSLLFYIIP
jgi:hypothetical protein